MNASDLAVAAVAAAIGEPARARMLFSLMDGRARTSTELAVLADVSPSTASVHLSRLKAVELVRALVQGRHRFYNLAGPEVASALEGLSVIAGGTAARFKPSTPARLRGARTCYDHLAGELGVRLHDALMAKGWLSARYEVSPGAAAELKNIGIDLAPTRLLRRRFAYACLDWSERRPHLGGALAAALLTFARRRRWVVQELDSRVLAVTSLGRRELLVRFGVRLAP